MKKKCTKKKLTAEQKAAQLKKRKVLAFRKKIRSSFTDAGFTYFSTLDKHFPIGTRTVELDYLFLSVKYHRHLRGQYQAKEGY